MSSSTDRCSLCGQLMGTFRGWDPERGVEACFKCYINIQKRDEEKEMNGM